MIGPYIQAIEAQLDWLKRTDSQPVDGEENVAVGSGVPAAVLRLQREALSRRIRTADTFFMNRQFCDLVDHAFESVPPDLRFDLAWMQSSRGFMHRETKFLVAEEDVANIEFDTFIWFPKTADIITVQWIAIVAEQIGGSDTDIAFSGEVYLKNDQPLSEAREGQLEKVVTWLYCAFHIMAQRVATTVAQKVDRAVKRRSERQQEHVPEIVKVITLRRLEEAREREAPHDVNWKWQWEVRGHWRNQFYPSENVHKPVFVEAYIKGPTDKPFKSPGLKLFAAVR